MLDIGWTELLVIGIVALLVVPPKDLPVLLRTVGKYVGQLRRMATDFRGQFDQAMRDAELAEIRDSVKKQVDEIKAPIAAAERSLGDTMRAIDKPAAAATAATMATHNTAVGSSETAATVLDAATNATDTPAIAPVSIQETAAVIPRSASLDQAAATSYGKDVMTTPDQPMAVATPEPELARPSIAQRAAEAWKKAAGNENGV
jgi:sec-independent protein translocase protein TatB